MSDRRSARRSAKQSPERGGIIPDELRTPSVRDRLRGGWSTEDMDALRQARCDWYAENGYDYTDWRVRNQVERGL